MIRDHIDLLFCNEHEMTALYQTDALEPALARAAAEVPVVVCTIGPRGALVLEGDERHHAPAVETRIVDLTGAGDLFAAGFLHGVANDRDLMTSARMGCVAAAEVIDHIGARPNADLKALYAGHGLT